MASKTRAKEGERRGRGSPLERLERVLEEGGRGLLLHGRSRREAFRWAQAFEAAADTPRAALIAALAYASDVFVAHAVELAAAQDELSALIERIESRVGIPRLALAREVLGAPRLLQ